MMATYNQASLLISIFLKILSLMLKTTIYDLQSNVVQFYNTSIQFHFCFTIIGLL